METPNVQAVKDKIAEIPAHKWPKVILRCIVGSIICVFGWYAKTHWPGVPDLVTYCTAVFGGTVIVGEIIAYPFKLFIGYLADVMNVVRGKTGTDDPPPQ